MGKSTIGKIMAPVQRFIHLEYTSGLVLLMSVVIAIVWANSGYHDVYEHLWHIDFSVGIGSFMLDYPLHIWINDGLMAVFFFVIGLELKREFLVGELSSMKKASLPLMAALGGMIVPALIYFFLNKGTEAAHGWGIPMATDIAFALALLSMASKHIPLSVKVFLSALAVADDLGAVLVIAFFYTVEINFIALGTGAAFLLILVLGNLAGLKHSLFYLVIGIGVWVGFLLSGVHATIAGVLVAFAVPAATRINGKSLEDVFHPWVAFGIMPIFALANAGIVIGSDFFSAIANPVSIGVAGGLLIGKFAGILSFCWVMVKLKLASLPKGASWSHLAGVALLAGIGFTMSLFISGLAFNDLLFIDQAKYGILIASVFAGLTGTIVLRRIGKM